MKKRVLSLCLAVFLLGACAPKESVPETVTPIVTDDRGNTINPEEVEGNKDEEGNFVADYGIGAQIGLDENGRFIETYKITVEIYDRGLDAGRSAPEDNFWTNWIKEQVLNDLNIEVEFVPIPRWTEEDEIANLMNARTAPNICFTYFLDKIEAFAEYDGVIDLAQYFDVYRDLLPNVWNLLGVSAIYYDRDPDTGRYWCINGIRGDNSRINTFMRKDWLDTLELDVPASTAEFEAALTAFSDNAELLLGAQANNMVPFSFGGKDIGHRANNLLVSFVPDTLSDKDAWVYGYDDRQLLFPGYKEGVRLLNKWYNNGLIWQDFSLFDTGSEEENNVKAGYVGSFIHNWDYPYRDGEGGIEQSIKENVGPDASFIAIDPFENDAGLKRKFVYSSTGDDRKLFFPATNTEEENYAAMMYVDWISKPDVIRFLQIGKDGATHNLIFQDDGRATVELIPNPGTDIMINSQNNVDYTITYNGGGILLLGDYAEGGADSLAASYKPNDPQLIALAYKCAQNDARILPNYAVGGEMTTLPELVKKREVLLNQAINAAPEEFDAVYDRLFADYLNSGGQTIIDEREAAYEKYYGDFKKIP